MARRNVIYSLAYKNISHQVLEVEQGVIAPPGHIWSQFLEERYLSDEAAALRGFATQKLIDRGFIGRNTYIPVFNNGDIYFESHITPGTWFRAIATEFGPITTSDPKTTSDVPNMCYTMTRVDASVIQPSWLINYDVTFPPQIYLAMKISDTYMINMWMDLDIRNSPVWEKRPLPINVQVEDTPIAFPASINLIFQGDA